MEKIFLKIISSNTNSTRGIFNTSSAFLILAFFVLILISGSTATAQSSYYAKISVDTTVIRIGEQFHLNITATVPVDAQVTFPPIPDTIHKLEVVQRSAVDTSKSQDGKLATYHQLITLTGFDSGFFVIEPLTVFFKQKNKNSADSLTTEAMLMQVQTLSVDTTKDIKDIKPPLDVPFTFREALPYIIGGVTVIALAVILIYWLKKRKRKPQEVVKKIQLRPAHEIAEEALRKIKEQKLWQQGFYKEYHSGVSDTVRTYIENRFSITAMEMPSDDTLSHFRNSLVIPEAFEKLRYLLQSADMVKFARGIPVGPENELTMQHAFDFIALTKPVTKEDFPAVAIADPKEVTL